MTRARPVDSLGVSASTGWLVEAHAPEILAIFTRSADIEQLSALRRADSPLEAVRTVFLSSVFCLLILILSLYASAYPSCRSTHPCGGRRCRGCSDASKVSQVHAPVKLPSVVIQGSHGASFFVAVNYKSARVMSERPAGFAISSRHDVQGSENVGTGRLASCVHQRRRMNGHQSARTVIRQLPPTARPRAVLESDRECGRMGGRDANLDNRGRHLGRTRLRWLRRTSDLRNDPRAGYETSYEFADGSMADLNAAGGSVRRSQIY